MELPNNLKSLYSKDTKSYFEAQRLAQFIAFGPVVFQVSRAMLTLGVFKVLDDNPKGLTLSEIASKTNLSDYAVKVMLEASLSIGTVIVKEDKYLLTKTGWFLLNDEMTKVNFNFTQDVNYLGMFSLEKSLVEGKPEGLKIFGNWPTIYQGLSNLPKDVQQSWFGFDHFYSDHNFVNALQIVMQHNPKHILDVGGNTGRFACKCVELYPDVNVTIMDLPQQLALMRNAVKDLPFSDRILEYPADVLAQDVVFPSECDVVWMSQFLDCFSEEQILHILTNAKKTVSNGHLYIMETFWDRQKYEAASFVLTMTSLYFTAMANGNSKMYYSKDMLNIAEQAGFKIENIYDMEYGHSLVELVVA